MNETFRVIMSELVIPLFTLALVVAAIVVVTHYLSKPKHKTIKTPQGDYIEFERDVTQAEVDEVARRYAGTRHTEAYTPPREFISDHPAGGN